MTHRWIITPIAALTVLAGYVGLQLGQPVTETDIINQYAAIYVAENGHAAKMTDCLATPSQHPDVRLVVRCTHPDGTIHSYFAGPRAELRDPTSMTEPQA